jgi:hypothetical protein
MTDLFSAAAPRDMEVPKVKENQVVFEKYMTLPEAGRAFNVAPHVVRQATDNGRVEIFAINGSRKILTEQFSRYLEERAKRRSVR